MSKKIALIDDSAPFRLMVKQLLELREYEVTPFDSAEQFFGVNQRITLTRFDLIIVDINLPDMDGLSVLEQLKTDPLSNPIPVLIVTGEPKKTNIKHAIQFGVNDFIGKPIDPAQFCERVERLLNPSMPE
ncbi:response regulator [Paenibacillus mesophilus]|uniref:response regulator n=1 Tax=Paenibacillus mesophilus TaxID=2582849 RepID=UPI0013051C78|nr:response regulator [Paenibacillus mesophilus]